MNLEINGFDESGNIGANLRFIRVGMDISSLFKVYVYNILHFGSVVVPKRALNGIDIKHKQNYIKNILSDPAFDVNCYYFLCEDQIKVLSLFTRWEQQGLFAQRRELIQELEEDGGKTERLKAHINYLKRYERSPYWMESFVKAYGFRMVFSDLRYTSKVLRNPRIPDYRVMCFVDGGYPFVFWWKDFLKSQGHESRFHLNKTPVFGITNGDEYYPQINLAGTIAYITSNKPEMLYPHTIRPINILSEWELKDFYAQFAYKRGYPHHHRRILYFGDIPQDFQYLLPFALNYFDKNHAIYEPFRLKYDPNGSVFRFERTFGEVRSDDTVVQGQIRNEKDESIQKEFEELGLRPVSAEEYIGYFDRCLENIKEEAECSNLHQDHKAKVRAYIESSKTAVERKLSNDGDA